MRKSRLFTRLLVALLPLLALFLLIQIVVGYRMHAQALRLEGRLQAGALSRQMALLAARDAQAATHFKDVPGVTHAAVLDSKNVVTAATDAREVGSIWNGPSPSAPPPESWLWSGSAEATALIPGQAGSVALVLRVDELKGQENYLDMAGVCLALLGLTAVGLSGVARYFTGPILDLAEKARLLARAEDKTALPPKRQHPGEAGILEQALYDMLDRVLSSTAAERDRRLSLQTRLDALLAATEAVAEGKLKTRLPSDTQDDIGRLETGFNQMVESLWLARRAELQAELEREWARISVEEANRRLQELDRRKTDFLNTASHELRTPLTSIKAFAEIIQDNVEGPEEAHGAADFLEANGEFLSIIDEEAERLARLIVSLLDLSAIESGAQDWDYGPLEAGQLVEHCRRSFQSLLQEKNLELLVTQDQPIPFEGAANPLRQVLANLLSNAIKFTPSGGQIRFRLRTSADKIIFEIEDSGIGIATEDQARLFQNFQQAEEFALPGAPKGSGLGLAICRDIVERHQGTIELSSQIGKGSCFTIRLPLQTSKN